MAAFRRSSSEGLDGLLLTFARYMSGLRNPLGFMCRNQMPRTV